MRSVSRRTFIQRLGFACAGGVGLTQFGVRGSAHRTWRAAIIGCTGEGDYGHELDAAFNEVTGVEVMAVADPNALGRARAATRSKALRQYADYREMLKTEQPELVVVAPRWSERHFEMAMAALQSGAHVLTEKPFTVDLAEAGALLATATRTGRKIAVAHQMRLSPNVVHLRQAVADGLIGDLVHLRAWGKQDARAGGEDLIVLGTHLFDLMRLFAGDAVSCTAQVFTDGREITRADARPATERIGPIAGTEIEAQFRFGTGATASFTSRGRLRETLGPWAVEFIGSKGVARVSMDIDPIVRLRKRRSATALTVVEEWEPQAGDPARQLSPEQRGFGPANRRVVADWLEAIAADREPQCSGHNAMKALEFVMAVYEAALTRAQVQMPLSRRKHPLV